MRYEYHEPTEIAHLQHDGFGGTLQHEKKTADYYKTNPDHKYISREWKNGHWIYTYPTQTISNTAQSNFSRDVMNGGNSTGSAVGSQAERDKIAKEKAKADRQYARRQRRQQLEQQVANLFGRKPINQRNNYGHAVNSGYNYEKELARVQNEADRSREERLRKEEAQANKNRNKQNPINRR